MLRAAGVPFWRLSGFYFFYFAVLGAWLPYWNLYLEHQGFDTVAIGILSAVVLGTKIFAPTLWGMLTERIGKPMRMIQLGSLFTLVAISAVFSMPGFWGMLLIILVYSFFWNAVLPQFDTATINHLGEHFNQYSKVRLWGSVGFVGAVVCLGFLFEYQPISLLPVALILALNLMFITSLSLKPAKQNAVVSVGGSVKHILKQKQVLAFFVAVALLQFSLGPYYTFYSIFLEDLGYGVHSIGLLWSLGVVAEIILFMFMHKLLPRFGVKTILLISLLLTAVRWLVTGACTDIVVIAIVSQLLHAATYGACHAAAVEFIRTRFGVRQSIGQAIYSSVSFGIGGAAGALVSGYLWQYSVMLSFGVAAAASLVAFCLVWRYFDNDLTDTIEPANRTELL